MMQFEVTQPLLNPNNSSINNQKEQQDESMSTSDAVASPPSLPPLLSTTNSIEENVIEDSIIIPTKDLNVSVKLEIYNLIQLLSNCIGDISGDKKISLDEMDEYNVELKKCLASIEVGLTEQMNIMEESLMSTDVNCCRALYDHQIEAMNEMFKEFNELIEIQRN
uniref:Uncharacterized protein n=1 Tax=Panagrolaimus superbus TaxID=310955 RepID=A0A914Z6N1_9BILA